VSELERIGDLGHGSCGHVVKMRHGKTGTMMAVKVPLRSRLPCLSLSQPSFSWSCLAKWSTVTWVRLGGCSDPLWSLLEQNILQLG